MTRTIRDGEVLETGEEKGAESGGRSIEGGRRGLTRWPDRYMIGAYSLRQEGRLGGILDVHLGCMG